VFVTPLLYSIYFALSLTIQLASADTIEKPLTFLCSEFPPFEYSAPDGKPSGYSIEILEAIMKESGITGNIQIVPWKRAYLLAQRDVNTAVFTMARTQIREKLFKWVGPIAQRKIYLWKLKNRADINANNWEDVKKYTIGTVRGEAGEQQIIDKGFNKNKNISPVINQVQNYKKLFLNRIDFIYGLELSTNFGLKKAGFNPNDLEKSLLLSEGLGYYYGFNLETDDAVIEKFTVSLKRLKSNGTIEKIEKKYTNEVY
jgi:polar amino acid transport system substrate-binding protein